jgi:hypothetical protein
VSRLIFRKNVVKHCNKFNPTIDLAIVTGDLTDSGKIEEYEEFNKMVANKEAIEAEESKRGQRKLKRKARREERRAKRKAKKAAKKKAKAAKKLKNKEEDNENKKEETNG